MITISLRDPVARFLYSCLLVLSLNQAPPASADVLGGLLDGGSRRAVIVTEESSGARATAAYSSAPIVLGSNPGLLNGQLIAVRPDRSWRIVARLNDRRVMIAPPLATASKVVFLDAQDQIIGGIGLSPAEVSAVAAANGVTELKAFDALASRTSAIAWYGALNAAGAQLAKSPLIRDSERGDVLAQTMAAKAGTGASDLAQSLRWAAYRGQTFGRSGDSPSAISQIYEQLFRQAASDEGTHLAVGLLQKSAGGTILFGDDVGMLAHKDNGGGGGSEGYVAHKDNGGGGGSEGYVAHKDNGGGGGSEGYVAHKDNGGGGGSEGLVVMPIPLDLSVWCTGTFFYIEQQPPNPE